MSNPHTPPTPRFKPGRAIALAGVWLAVGLAIGILSLLAVMLLPQIFPTLFPAVSPTPELSELSEPSILRGGHRDAGSRDIVNPARIAAMQPETVQSIVQTARDAWIKGDAEQFAALFTEDGELVVPGQVWRGRAAIRDALADFAKAGSQVEIAIQRIILDGDQAVVEWHWSETAPTGKQTNAEDAIVVDFRDGQIRRWREYIDSTT